MRGAALALGSLAVEGFVYRFTEGIPEFLLLAAIERHPMGFSLPALLQGFDGIDAQHGCCTQDARLLDHGLTARQTLGLGVFQGLRGQGQSLLPQRLQFGKHLLTHMTTFAPTVAKLVQCAVDGFPVPRTCMLLRPDFDFLDQGQALRLVLCSLAADLVQPCFHHLVRGVACLIKFFPQTVVGSAPLVGLFPLVTQLAQRFLHLAATQRLAVRALEQAFGLGQQFFTHLVSAPALPAFKFARRHQGSVYALLQCGVDMLAVCFEHGTQRRSRTGTGLAVPFGCFLLQPGQGLAHHQRCLGHHLGIYLGPWLAYRAFWRNRRLGGHSPRQAQFVSPHGHGRQGRLSVFSCGHGQCHRRLKRIPNHQQLDARGIEQRGETGLHTGPARVT